MPDNRLKPLNWVVTSNDGTNIVANNPITGETFSGTTANFNKMMASKNIDPEDSMITMADGSKATEISTTTSKWVDNFAGLSFAAGAASLAELTARGLWNVVRNTGGMTLTLTPGNLAVAMGTTNGAELLLVGNTNCTIPSNLGIILNTSQRISGNEIRVGYLEVDPDSGLPIDNPNLPNFFRNLTAALLTGTTTTTVVLETVCDNNNAIKIATVASQTASTTSMEYTLECRPEDVTYQQIGIDSTALKVATGGRLSSMVPNPNKTYRPFIWLRNVSAPATNTTVNILRACSMDIQELQAEIGGGRGNLALNQAIPVVPVPGGGTLSISGNVGVTSATVSTASSGNLIAKVLSAATNNLTLVKAAAGKLTGGLIGNNAATWAYLRIYAATSTAGVTMGTTSPVCVIPLPPNGIVDLATMFDQYGLNIATGIVYAITAGAADLDNTALASANTVVGTLLYA